MKKIFSFKIFIKQTPEKPNLCETVKAGSGWNKIQTKAGGNMHMRDLKFNNNHQKKHILNCNMLMIKMTAQLISSGLLER